MAWEALTPWSAGSSKEEMATVLKEQMSNATYPRCGWNGYIDTVDGKIMEKKGDIKLNIRLSFFRFQGLG